MCSAIHRMDIEGASLWRPEVAEAVLSSGRLCEAVCSEDADSRAIGRDGWATVVTTAGTEVAYRLDRQASAEISYPLLYQLGSRADAIREACLLDYRSASGKENACSLFLAPSDASGITLLRLGFGETAIFSGFAESEVGLDLAPADLAALKQRGRLVDSSSTEEADDDDGVVSRAGCARIVTMAAARTAATAASLLVTLATNSLRRGELAASSPAAPLLHDPPLPIAPRAPLSSLVPAAYLRNMLLHCTAALISTRRDHVFTPRVLCLGTGLGVLPAVLLAQMRLLGLQGRVGEGTVATCACCCVDNSEAVLSLAQTWTGLGAVEEDVVFVLEDAASFVSREAASVEHSLGTFSLIAVDLYSAGAWPPQASTSEFWVGVSSLLYTAASSADSSESGGPTCDPVVIVNLDPRLPCFATVIDAMRAAFEDVCDVTGSDSQTSGMDYTADVSGAGALAATVPIAVSQVAKTETNAVLRARRRRRFRGLQETPECHDRPASGALI